MKDISDRLKAYLPTIILLFILSSEHFAQVKPADYPFNHIDVLGYNINVDLTKSFEQKNNSLQGYVKIVCKVDTANLDKLYLDAISLVIDSVFVNDTPAQYSQLEKYLVVMLQKSYKNGDTLNIHIFYQRLAQNTPAYYFFQKSGSNPPEDIAFTASWPANTRYWLPCKDWPSDKAIVEMKIKVPSDIIAVSNGNLIDKIDGPGYTIFTWGDKYPMATYVISISASKYVSTEKRISRFSDPSDSILVKYYAYPSNLMEMVAGLEKVPQIINFYSQRFAEFPFDYLNLVYVPKFIFSAMSNQTTIQFVRIPIAGDVFLLPHEIAHQWFGSYVNSADWNLWATEGLAEYAALFYRDFVIGNNFFRRQIINSILWALQQDSLSINDGGSGKDFHVLEMLRSILGDSIYWNAFKQYLTASGYGSAKIKDFNRAVNVISGENFDWYFDNWFYKPGHPIYHLSWNSEKVFDKYYVFLRIEQKQTRQEVFTMPADITFVTGNTDTTVKVFNNMRTQEFEFRLNSKPLNVIFDKDTLILVKELNYDTSSFIGNYSYTLKQNYPNPFNGTTKIEYQLAPTSGNSFVIMKVYDILGSEICTLVNEQKNLGIYGVEFDGKNLPSGVYFYHLQAGDFVETRKMILLH